MVYFITDTERGPQFTKTNRCTSKKYLYKLLILFLVFALILFGVAVSTASWYSLIITSTPAGSSRNVSLRVTVGLAKFCVLNESSKDEACERMSSRNMTYYYRPLDETKNFIVLVVVFTSFALLTGGSTWFCKAGVPKKVAMYGSAACILLAGICGGMGLREADQHFPKKVDIFLQKIINDLLILSSKDVSKGYSYVTAIIGELCLIIALILYITDKRLPKEKRVEKKDKQIPHYRIMRRLSTKGGVGGVKGSVRSTAVGARPGSVSMTVFVT